MRKNETCRIATNFVETGRKDPGEFLPTSVLFVLYLGWTKIKKFSWLIEKFQLDIYISYIETLQRVYHDCFCRNNTIPV